MVNELKDKAPAVMAMAGPVTAGPLPAPISGDGDVLEPAMAGAPSAPANAASAAQPEAMSALANLGYPPAEAARAVAEALAEIPQAETPDLIRAALRRLAPKG